MFGVPINRLVRVAFWSAMAAALILASLPQPPRLPGNPSDKIQHVMAFFCLAVLATTAYPKTSAPKLLAGLSAYGALIEAVQLIPMLHRDSELLDWIADTMAAAVGLVAAFVWRAAYRP